jgi:hypothetical protein
VRFPRERSVDELDPILVVLVVAGVVGTGRTFLL